MMSDPQVNCTKNNKKNQEKKLLEEKITILKRSSNQLSKIIFEFDKKKGKRMLDCASILFFKTFKEINYRKLFKAFMCKIMLCPFCMTRKSILLGNNLRKVLQYGADENKFEYIHLVLAQKNCQIFELKKEIEHVLYAFEKLRKRDIFNEKRIGTIKGWFRNLEITFNSENKTFHPHFHIILAVEKSYFFKETNPNGYLTQDMAIQMWKECLEVDYLPTADLSKVYYRDEKGDKIINFDNDNGIALKNAVEEASKYITKALDILKIEDKVLQKKVIKVMLESLRGKRLFAYGGVLKKIKAKLKLQDEEKANLINIGDEDIDTTNMEYVIEIFKWVEDNGGNYENYLEMSKEEYVKLEQSLKKDRENSKLYEIRENLKRKIIDNTFKKDKKYE